MAGIVETYCMAGLKVKAACDIVGCQLRGDSPPEDVSDSLKLLCPLDKERKN